VRANPGFRQLLAVIGAALAVAGCGTATLPGSGAAEAVPSHPHPAVAAANRPAPPSPAASPSPASSAQPTEYGYGTAPVPAAAQPVDTTDPAHVIGDGSASSCTSAAVVQAVAEGGIITFNCGPDPVTITMTATAKVVNTNQLTVIDGGGKVTLSGGGQLRILYMNTCDPQQVYTTSDCWEQQYPQLVVQNMTFEDAYSAIQQTSTSDYGGGAIFDEGGQLKVLNSGFLSNGCYPSGPDLGGAAIRALGMYTGSPVYLADDTFTGGRCSNGGALSSIDAGWDVIDSMFSDNQAVGFGANPASAGTAGGGSGGAIYTDGDNYNVTIDDCLIRGGSAREGGGAIFFVVDAGSGTLTIENSSVLQNNPSGEFQNAPGIFDSVDQQDTSPVITSGSVVND
jgi:hypothetical protein